MATVLLSLEDYAKLKSDIQSLKEDMILIKKVIEVKSDKK